VEITEVRIKLMENAEDRLRAFCSVTFDHCFVVRDLKIIEGNNGPFVAMPSRKLTAHCRNCNSKNHFRARFCNQCGKRLSPERVDTDDQGRAKLYADIAHPVNAECRERIQNRVISEFFDELERAKQPGYVSRYDEDYSESARVAPPAAANIEMGHAPQSLRGPHQPEQEADNARDPVAHPPHGKGPEFGSGIF
jgi:stage V sporulation protein G